jgi:CRP/FNR family transcriptional regulator, cyclic AMP receptor protein
VARGQPGADDPRKNAREERPSSDRGGADALFYIQKGKVQITVVSDQGNEGVIELLEAGEFFRERCLARPPLHIETASAMTESVIVRIEKEAMIRVLREQPAFS